MVSYTDPFAPTIDRPVGLDAEIQRLQLLLLAGLPWLQLSYGKAYRGSRKVAGKMQYYPEVYAGAGEYRDVLPNDNVQAQSFFYPTGPALNPEREPVPGTLRFSQSVDLVFWLNLHRIDPTKKYRFENELVVDVARILNEDGKARILRVYTAAEDVFKGFSLELVKSESALRQPYAGFRLSLEVQALNVLCEPEFTPGDGLQLRDGGYVRLRGN